MLTRHANELLFRLETVVDIGCCTIRKAELLTWYNQDRVTVSIWRDVQDKWQEILEAAEKNDVPLLVGDSDGVYAFVWGEGLIPSAGRDPRFKNVRDLSRRETHTEKVTETPKQTKGELA